ncbi:MAG: histidine kinase [Bacillota bacterium]|nr:histidine kinase [Bacillota bacterium]
MKIKKHMKKIAFNLYVMIRKVPIFGRLMIGFVSVIVITGIIMTHYIYKQTEKQFYTTGISYIYENLDNTVQRTYVQLRDYETQVENIAADYERFCQINSSISKTEVGQYLCEKKREMSVEGLFVLTENELYTPLDQEGKPEGIEFTDVEKFKESKIYQDACVNTEKLQWFNTLTENDLFYANEKHNSFLGNFITMTCRIGDYGETKGLVIMVMDIARISGIASTNKLYNQDLFLADSNGIITYLSRDYIYRDYPENVFEKAALKEGEILTESIGGRKTVFVSQPIDRGDWYVVSVVIEKNLMKNSLQLQAIVVTISIVTIVVSLLICFVVTVSISYPLNRLQNAMKNYAQQDFSTQYEDIGNDQIAMASKVFKSMAGRINDLAQEQLKTQAVINEEKLKQKEMYISALQMQINPHFLYNMLDLIRWHIVRLEKGNGRISRMVSGYSGMLRYNIKIGDTYTKLENELAYIEKYVGLLELLYDKKIKIEVFCEKEEIKQCLVAKLLLQPVVENTITHGKINLLDEPLIRIDISKKENIVFLKVYNNGKVIDEETAKTLTDSFVENDRKYTRVGLGNVNRRIKLLFGEEYGMKIYSQDEMTCVEMVFPDVSENTLEGGS